MDLVRRLSIAERLAAIAGLAAVSASLAGFAPGLYRDSDYSVAGSHGQDVANLLGATVLWIALAASARGSLRGRLVAVGAVGYLMYSYVAYAYMMVVNPASLLYIAVLGFSAWALGAGLASFDDVDIARTIEARLPRRPVAVVFVATAVLFALLWLGQIAAAVTSGALPADLVKAGWPTSPYYANDLAIVLPLIGLAGGWLWTNRPIGTRLAVPVLVFAVLMDLSIFATLVSGALANQAVLEPAVAAIFIVHAAICGGLATVALAPARRRPYPPLVDRAGAVPGHGREAS